MDKTPEDAEVGLAERSRRIFMHGAGLVGLGLATGAAVPAASSGHGDAGNETETEEETPVEEETTGDGEPTQIDSCTVIDEPGAYELVSDLTPESLDQPACLAVDLGESDGSVTIDGNGHTIDLSEMEAGRGVDINFTNQHDGEGSGPDWDASVENLTIRGDSVYSVGIGARHDTASRITDVTLTGHRAGVSFGSNGGTFTNCIIAENTVGAELGGGEISGGSYPTFERCTIRANDEEGVQVGHNSHATLKDCRVVANAWGVYVSPRDTGAVLEGCHICRNTEYGVEGDKMTEEDTDEGNLQGHIRATNNYWGAPNGPSSYGDPEEPYDDPDTGRPADGNGDAISEGFEPGVSNVRFDPFLESTIDGVGADR